MGQDFNNKQNKLNNQPKLQTKDFISIFWRSGFEQASWNYERMQNLGFAFILSPAIKRLYPEKKRSGCGNETPPALFQYVTYYAIAGYWSCVELGREKS